MRNGLLSQIIKPSVAAGLESDHAGVSSLGLQAYIAGLEAECGFNSTVGDLLEIEGSLESLQQLTGIQSRLVTMTAHIDGISADGMTKREANYLAGEVASIHEQLGTNEVIVLAGLESFGSSITAKAYTEAALLSGDNALQKVWAWIMEMLKKLKDIIAGWWSKFFGDVERLEKYADKVKAASKSYKDEKDNKKITVKQGALGIGTDKPTGANIVSGVKELGVTVTGWLTTHITNCESACDAVSNTMDAAGGTDEALKAAYAKCPEASVKGFLEGSGVPASGKTIGNKFVELDAVATTNTAADTTTNRTILYNALAKTNYKVKSDTVADKDQTIDRLAKSEVEGVADEVKDMATALLSLRKSREDARKYADDIEKAAKSVQKESTELDAGDKVNKGELVAMAKAGITTLSELTSGAVSSWTANCVRVGFAALKAAEQSI